MASATLAVKGHDTADVVLTGGTAASLTLASITPRGVIYRDASLSLSRPLTIEFDYQIGSAGAKGNDRLIIKTSQVLTDAATTGVVVGGAKIEMSVPRDAVWTAAYTQKHLAYLVSVIGLIANRANISNGVVS